MKLHWSPKSPFVRKVMIVAHEAAQLDHIGLLRTVAAMKAPNAALMADNPLNKIPTLVLDDGTALYDSTVICEYLDSLNGQRDADSRLFPREGVARWDALRRNALGSGLLDVLILWRNERERPAPSQSAALLTAFAEKVEATLGRLEAETPAPPATRFDIGDIAVGCALAYLDFRFGSLDWRSRRQRLAAWYACFSTRPSVKATEIVDDAT